MLAGAHLIRAEVRHCQRRPICLLLITIYERWAVSGELWHSAERGRLPRISQMIGCQMPEDQTPSTRNLSRGDQRALIAVAIGIVAITILLVALLF